ncbi:MAG TPA: glycosyltransferase family 4 protein [Saprospiraceae bacterium]|nr:glycosyltransferase family 4 protein [Saprospiraceae bacterium]HMP22659.1 glycosyltransferase family 4 protein [Saprospiraceae bacterium]
MKKQLRTIAITGNYARWVYQFRIGLLRKLQQSGIKVVVIAAPDRFERKFIKEKFLFEPIRINFYGNNPLDDAALLQQLYHIYRKHEIDAVIHYTIKPNIYGGMAAKMLGIPSYAVVTGMGHVSNRANGLISWAGLKLYRLALPLHRKVMVLNQRDQRELLQMKMVESRKLMLLPGEGVDTHFFQPLSDKKMPEHPSFLFSGRLMADKGIFEFVQAARVIRQRHPQVRFRILGMLDPKGIHSIPIQTVKQWVNEGVIEYLGETVDVRPFLAKADCVVLPSYYREGLSRILMEAASMETPIITTDQAGCREVVDDGRTGFLCRPQDVAHLVAKMEAFIHLDKIDRLIMGKNARMKMERQYDESIIIQQYLDLLQEDFLLPGVPTPVVVKMPLMANVAVL